MTTDTLGRLDEGHEFHGHCPRCNRHFMVPAAPLMERLGPDTPVIVAMQKVTCSQCGGRASLNRGYAPKRKG